MNYVESLLSYDMDEYDDSVQLESDLTQKNEIEKIIECYFTNTELSDSQINNLTCNHEFQIELLKDIQKRMKNIITDSSTLLYKELVTVISLLSLGKKFAIFDKYNVYSIEEIQKLFRVYEKCLQESFEDHQKYELLFNYYLTLLDAYNELCLINLTDVVRQKSIRKIVDAMTESINMLKFSVTLDEKKLELLNLFQGKLLINFSYLGDMDFNTMKCDEVVQKYCFYFNKISDGHYLTSSSNSKYLHELYSLRIHTLLLSCITQLEEKDDYDEEVILPLLNLYEKSFKKEKSILEYYGNIKELLLKEYIHVFRKEWIFLGNQEIITYLMKEGAFGRYYEFIYVLISYSHDMEIEFLTEVLNGLLQVEKLNNDYHEYFKLMAIDAIINKIIQMHNVKVLDRVHPVIEKYIKNFNIASHLMTAFSKIYLSMSLYYSFKGSEYLKESQRSYFKSEKICSYTLIKHEYKNMYDRILYNNARTFLESAMNTEGFSKKEMITVGQSMMNDFFSTEMIRVYHMVSYQVEKVIEFVFTQSEYDKNKVIENIEQVISSGVLFGLAQCIITDKTYQEPLGEVGYEYKEVQLIDDYKIIYKYSYTYKDSFNTLYLQNSEYIKNKVSTFISTLRVKQNMNSVIGQYLYDEDEINII